MSKENIQEETFKFLKIVEALEDYIKEFAIPLLHIAADSGSNEKLTKAVGVLIWKLERTKVNHSSKIFLDLIGQGFTDVQKDEIKSIYKEISEKISSQTLPSAFYDFMKSTMSEDESTIKTRIIKDIFFSFLRDYFKVRYVNGVLSYWNRVEYVQGKSQLTALIHNILYFFEINSFQSESAFVEDNFAEHKIRSENYIDNYRLPLQNFDLIIDKQDPNVHTLKLANKSASEFVTCALKISILEDENLNLLDVEQVSRSIYEWLEQKEQYPAFQNFITDMFGNNTDKINRFAEILGSTFLRDNKIKAKGVAFLVGPRSTGKSSILNIFTQVIGTENCCSINPNELGERFSLQSAVGKRVNFVHEAPSSNLEHNCVAKFRSIVSNDPVNVDTKYGKPSQYRFYMRNIFACNSLPFIKWDADDKGTEAFLYRIQIFPITKKFKESDLSRKYEHDQNFLYALFVFALKGALRLLKNGEFSYCYECEQAMKEYLNDLSPLYEYVTKVCDKHTLIDIPVDKVFATEWELEKYTIDGAYKRFKEWARGEGYFPRGDYPIKKNFCSAVTEVYKDVEVKRGSLWLDNGVTKERTQRNIFALKKSDKE